MAATGGDSDASPGFLGTLRGTLACSAHGFYAGSVIGLTAVAPAMWLFRGVCEKTALVCAIGYTALAGITAGGVYGSCAAQSLNAPQATPQTHLPPTVSFSKAGGVFGLLAAAASPVPRSCARGYGALLLGGAAAGCAAGTALQTAYSAGVSCS